ncbi:MAG TPA: sodium:proline symporter [Phycisphaerae bacterium]|jgi:SSS family solute:Na+ symporter|nr:sodium:proline symporter [Phycisphaerae bacterium]HOB73968.1 sodium:proline symporter [Phycisphaerae bacterium]HOJ55356.1 sodium:proline symporter [Phycisphaerae bacterium]HOL25109.1 sodium:proline symporter [Phycisphaerae bacterium]HPP19715.1 sodium:proline symporter [Phycisphaerae bacterium]
MKPVELLIDGSIIVLYFAAIVFIGLRIGRRETTLEGYALGGRKVPWWAVMASIIAAEVSAATFIGGPAEGFSTRGITYVQLALGLLLGRVLVGQLFLKPYYTYRVYTVYDFLAVRFGPMSKNYVSILFLIMRTLASGVRLYIPSLIMVLAWRLIVEGRAVEYGELESWQPYVWAIVLLTVITCLYTAIGGIKAVIWTDVIQATLMFASALVAIGTLLYKIGEGSFINAFHVLAAYVPEMKTTQGYFLTGLEKVEPGMSLWDILVLLLGNKYTLPSALIATTLHGMAAFGTDQDMVQRMLTAETYKKSRLSLVSSALMNIPVTAAFTFIGVLLIAFYNIHPELRPMKDNDVFGQYILMGMPVVVRGFVLAGIFATAMGSLSAALNSLATSLTNDWYIPYLARHRSDEHHVRAARLFTALFAALMIGIAIIFAVLNVKNPKMTIIPIALGVAGYVLGPMLGVFVLGMVTRRRGSDRGNMIAVTAGLLAILVTSGLLVDAFNAMRPGATPLVMPFRIEFTWYATIGGLVTFVIGLLFRTPEHVVVMAEQKARQRAGSESVPLGVEPIDVPAGKA